MYLKVWWTIRGHFYRKEYGEPPCSFLGWGSKPDAKPFPELETNVRATTNQSGKLADSLFPLYLLFFYLYIPTAYLDLSCSHTDMLLVLHSEISRTRTLEK
jgi:hypothetical protein